MSANLREQLAEVIKIWRKEEADYKKGAANHAPLGGSLYVSNQSKWALSQRHADQLDALLSSSSAGSTEGWQPIETAPKDGTEVLISATWQGGGEIAVGRWVATERRWNAGYATSYEPAVVTHWMPLPSSPVDREPTTEGTT